VKEEERMEDLRAEGVVIKTDLEETGSMAWIGFIWLRIGPCDGILGQQS